MANKRYRPEWDYSFTMDGVVSCAFCMTQDRPIFVRGGQTIGVCEPCAGIAHFMWKQEPGDVPPSFTDAAIKEVTRVYLVIPRLSQTRAKPHSELPTDYEFVVVTDEDGKLDLPSAVVAKDEKLNVAAVRALGALGLSTWSRPDFLETLYTAYTPRGRLATVMLVRAWRLENAQATNDTLAWRSWEDLNKSSAMTGFYTALEPVWAMRVFRHNRATGENPTTDISVRIRSIAAQFIELQKGLREGDKNLDTSMFEYMKRKVTEDEKAIDKLIAQHETQSRLLANQKSKDVLVAIGEGDGKQVMIKNPSEGSGAYRRIDEKINGDDLGHLGDDGEGSDSEGEEEVGSPEGPVDDNDDVEDPSDDEDSDDGTEDEDSEVGDDEVDDSPPEGFARAGRPLSMKPGDE